MRVATSQVPSLLEHLATATTVSNLLRALQNKIFVTNLEKKEQKHVEDQYYDIQRRTEIKDTARELRRKYLRYKDAELVYSIQHKKLLELADRAGAIYRIDGYVLINRDIFDEYLEQFRETGSK